MMLKANLELFSLFGLFLLALSLGASTAEGKNQHCTPSCGNIPNISYPFRLKGDPPDCGHPSLEFELTCENNRTTLLLQPVKFNVLDIFYDIVRIRVVDATLDRNTCSIPHTFPLSSFYYFEYDFGEYEPLLFLNCTVPMNSSSYVNFSACIRNSSSPNTYFYALYNSTASELDQLCTIEESVLFQFKSENETRPLSVSDIQQELLQGFQLYWMIIDHKIPLKKRLIDAYYNVLYYIGDHAKPFILSIVGFISGRTLLGILFLIAILIYKFRGRHLSMDDTIEEFLQNHNNLMPIRYSYSQIKSMTNGFKDKLGQGGFGSVFKGKLRSGHLVAIKMLRESEASGKDFMNEVSTIGRIHHINVVKLTGFCVEGSKRALVYEFMPNGSLDKSIFSRGENSTLLSWNRMYEIAIGVARGIEYLHQGCDMQILHFDIKPHNILLDENFIPKVSDFGLAKLYPVNDSIVSLTAACGTPGYIAPELFYKNIGGISYKADVYSFGMLLMEMANRRKNVNVFADHSSQIYFPSWVYDQFDEGNDIEIEDATDEEKKIAKKMIMVALWCIQMKPNDRPSMNKVVEMLEVEVECLQMPARPFLSSEKVTKDVGDSISPTSSSIQSDESESINLICNAY